MLDALAGIAGPVGGRALHPVQRLDLAHLGGVLRGTAVLAPTTHLCHSRLLSPARASCGASGPFHPMFRRFAGMRPLAAARAGRQPRKWCIRGNHARAGARVPGPAASLG
ncbi:hypothetical protein C1N81_40740 [Streptomyces sp. SGAir0957]